MKFGKTIRKLREDRQISIARFAKQVGMSPTYLAPIERDVFAPPAEDKVIRIAKALGQDPDEMLALADRVATDLQDIIKQKPAATAQLLRAIKGMSGEKIAQLATSLERGGRKGARRR
ncbi:MAG: helix-turn-helix transcriptional regulator [Planctomycetota bacterium]